MEIHTPVYPLPRELLTAPASETSCEYCGVSYLIYHEIQKLKNQNSQLRAKMNEIKELWTVKGEGAKGMEVRGSVPEIPKKVLAGSEHLNEEDSTSFENDEWETIVKALKMELEELRSKSPSEEQVEMKGKALKMELEELRSKSSSEEQLEMKGKALEISHPVQLETSKVLRLEKNNNLSSEDGFGTRLQYEVDELKGKDHLNTTRLVDEEMYSTIERNKELTRMVSKLKSRTAILNEKLLLKNAELSALQREKDDRAKKDATEKQRTQTEIALQRGVISKMQRELDMYRRQTLKVEESTREKDRSILTEKIATLEVTVAEKEGEIQRLRNELVAILKDKVGVSSREGRPLAGQHDQSERSLQSHTRASVQSNCNASEMDEQLMTDQIALGYPISRKAENQKGKDADRDKLYHDTSAKNGNNFENNGKTERFSQEGDPSGKKKTKGNDSNMSGSSSGKSHQYFDTKIRKYMQNDHYGTRSETNQELPNVAACYARRDGLDRVSSPVEDNSSGEDDGHQCDVTRYDSDDDQGDEMLCEEVGAEINSIYRLVRRLTSRRNRGRGIWGKDDIINQLRDLVMRECAERTDLLGERRDWLVSGASGDNKESNLPGERRDWLGGGASGDNKESDLPGERRDWLGGRASGDNKESNLLGERRDWLGGGASGDNNDSNLTGERRDWLMGGASGDNSGNPHKTEECDRDNATVGKHLLTTQSGEALDRAPARTRRERLRSGVKSEGRGKSFRKEGIAADGRRSGGLPRYQHPGDVNTLGLTGCVIVRSPLNGAQKKKKPDKAGGSPWVRSLDNNGSKEKEQQVATSEFLSNACKPLLNASSAIPPFSPKPQTGEHRTVRNRSLGHRTKPPHPSMCPKQQQQQHQQRSNETADPAKLRRDGLRNGNASAGTFEIDGTQQSTPSFVIQPPPTARRWTANKRRAFSTPNTVKRKKAVCGDVIEQGGVFSRISSTRSTRGGRVASATTDKGDALKAADKWKTITRAGMEKRDTNKNRIVLSGNTSDTRSTSYLRGRKEVSKPDKSNTNITKKTTPEIEEGDVIKRRSGLSGNGRSNRSTPCPGRKTVVSKSATITDNTKRRKEQSKVMPQKR